MNLSSVGMMRDGLDGAEVNREAGPTLRGATLREANWGGHATGEFSRTLQRC